MNTQEITSEEVGREDVTAVIDATIEALPHHQRLYPDLYAHLVTKALIEAGLLS